MFESNRLSQSNLEKAYELVISKNIRVVQRESEAQIAWSEAPEQAAKEKAG